MSKLLRNITSDDIVFGYDLLFEKYKLWAKQRWLGIQTQQDPSDAWILQEILFDTKPDVLIETGTQNGGSAVFYASIMRMYTDTPRVITCDIDQVDAYKKEYAIPGFCEKVGCQNATSHILWKKHVTFLQGKSTNPHIISKIAKSVVGKKTMVVLDSLHSYTNVLKELRLYSKLVSIGNYLVVQDTKLDRIRARPHAWAATQTFLKSKEGQNFRSDTDREYLMYTQHKGGWLKRLK